MIFVGFLIFLHEVSEQTKTLDFEVFTVEFAFISW